MAWDDGNDNDPWKSRGNQAPADLDAIVRDLQRKLSGLFGGRGRGDDDGQGTGPGPKIGSGLVAFVVVLLVGVWSLLGFYIVDEAERGVVLRFGKYTNITLPGLRWHLPPPIERVVLVNTEEVVRWPYQGSMLTRDENIINVDLIVQYRRSDPQRFLFSLQEPEGTLQDVTASAIREVVGKNELDFILTDGRAEVSAQTQQLLQETLDSYQTGITIFEVNLQDANFPTAVEASVQDAIMAREDRERSILAAQSYTNDLLPRARGDAARLLQDAEAYRAQKINDAEGESSRFLQVLQEYQREPLVTRERLFIETIQEIYENSNKILVDSEGGNNLLYLPLDQLIQRRGSTATGSGQTSSPATSFGAGASNESDSSSSQQRGRR